MDHSPEATSSRSKLPVFITIVIAVVVIDQATKQWAVVRLSQGERIDVFGQFLQFTLYFNPGAAFGTAAGYTVLLSVLAIAASIAVGVMAKHLKDPVWAVGLGLFLGGALGNLIDRMVREPGFLRGHVVDFISYNNWFVGNVADIALTLAAVIIVFRSLQGISLDGTKEEKTATAHD